MTLSLGIGLSLAGQSPASGAWSPPELTNLISMWDASVTSSVTEVDGKIASLADLHTGGLDMENSVANRPVLTADRIDLDGTTWLEAALTSFSGYDNWLALAADASAQGVGVNSGIFAVASIGTTNDIMMVQANTSLSGTEYSPRTLTFTAGGGAITSQVLQSTDADVFLIGMFKSNNDIYLETSYGTGTTGVGGQSDNFNVISLGGVRDSTPTLNAGRIKKALYGSGDLTADEKSNILAWLAS